ncbi:hypothetical protein COCCADRAFT_106313 [Bipolaris zeicola 26-R-13]|uniref:Uncharacterized protein n=1 Tax=Cochliobolus carbonum (strain 26-R-13) TaxID=930089 RepID=W6YEA3_COCC2|nr:uncharacterized protein COCCADRAFT_106313 [Bipolaris zeicola 26-R-13]EUC29516.1 hypothetical protein COCCADRAFT_106313 [Bipolaris zeicola 26-R-13]
MSSPSRILRTKPSSCISHPLIETWPELPLPMHPSVTPFFFPPLDHVWPPSP